MDGLDSSKDMLSICENNCKIRGLNPKLYQAKMESFSLDTKYDAIIVPTGTFLLLHRREDSVKALRNFYKHLSNGGKLILDIFLQTEISIGTVSTRHQAENRTVTTRVRRYCRGKDFFSLNKL